MKKKKPWGKRVGKELKAIMERYNVTAQEMFEVMSQIRGCRGMAFRSFQRWINDETGSHRAEDAVRALEIYYRHSAARQRGEPITDPVTALRELHVLGQELQRIRALAVELHNLVEQVSVRHEAVSAALKLP